MAYLVTLDVFSGRENPKWVISDSESAELLTRTRGFEKRITEGKASEILGYRGIQVSPIERQDEKTERILRDAGGDGGPLYISDIPELEEYLLSTSGDSIEASVASHVREVLVQPQTRFPGLLEDVKCPTCQAADAPTYDPGYWNDPSRRPYNNCYNYANNQATNTFAQPGRATGKPITSLSCSGVQPSAQSDGLKAVPNFSVPLSAGHGWYVALVIWPGMDYHWYRQDNVGCWSHKPGQTAARNVDNSGKKITDPRICDRGPYSDFCTYMVTGKWVKIS